MQHIKNFREAAPQPFQLLQFPNIDTSGFRFFISEDNQDWYLCQHKFRDDTIKIAYDINNIIVSLVDRPVRERGNVYAISKLNMTDCSVVEIEQKDFPEGVKIDGNWAYINGRVVAAPNAKTPSPDVFAGTQQNEVTKTTPVVSSSEKTNREIYDELMKEAIQSLVVFQCAVSENKGDSEYEVCMIGKLQKYILQLVETDLQTNPVKWPTKDWPKRE